MLHIEEGKDDLAGKDKNLNTNADKGEKDFETKNALIIESLREKWGTLKGKNSHDCIRIFLTCTRKWQFFGSKLFEVQVMPHILSKIVLRLMGISIIRQQKKYLTLTDLLLFSEY